MDGHIFEGRVLAWHQPRSAGGEERRVLHAIGLASPDRIDDRDVPVRIGAEPFAVMPKRRPRAVEVTRRLRDVFGLQHETHVNRRQAGMLETLPPFDVVGARRPREIVNIFLVVPVRRRPVRIVGAFALAARRGKRPASRHGHPHVVNAVIGEELGSDVELMTVPFAGGIQHADLRKPLRDEEKVSDRARAREGTRNLRGPFNVERDGLSRCDRRRQITQPSPFDRRHCHRPVK